jgi:restriction system protein
VFRITQRGRELLALNLPRLTIRNFSDYPEFVAFRKGPQNDNDEGQEAKPEISQTPDEQLANAVRLLRDSLANDVLEAVRRISPTRFEELVVELLVAMGYGGPDPDASKAVGGPGDGGIDAVIREDKLGLDLVYARAKRWANPVGRPVVQAFAGSLDGERARKGVLITTSYLSQDAWITFGRSKSGSCSSTARS